MLKEGRMEHPDDVASQLVLNSKEKGGANDNDSTPSFPQSAGGAISINQINAENVAIRRIQAEVYSNSAEALNKLPAEAIAVWRQPDAAQTRQTPMLTTSSADFKNVIMEEIVAGIAIDEDKSKKMPKNSATVLHQHTEINANIVLISQPELDATILSVYQEGGSRLTAEERQIYCPKLLHKPNRVHSNKTVVIFVPSYLDNAVEDYSDLIQSLAHYYSIYGFVTPSNTSPDLIPDSIDVITQNYVKGIAMTHPNTEVFLLIGAELGGIVAHEIATRLDKKNQIARAFIINPFNQKFLYNLSSDLQDHKEHIIRLVKKLRNTFNFPGQIEEQTLLLGATKKINHVDIAFHLLHTELKQSKSILQTTYSIILSKIQCIEKVEKAYLNHQLTKNSGHTFIFIADSCISKAVIREMQDSSYSRGWSKNQIFHHFVFKTSPNALLQYDRFIQEFCAAVSRCEAMCYLEEMKQNLCEIYDTTQYVIARPSYLSDKSVSLVKDVQFSLSFYDNTQQPILPKDRTTILHKGTKYNYKTQQTDHLNKKLQAVKNIFNLKETAVPPCILVFSESGGGKTTFCQYLINLTKSQELFNSKFDLVIYINLRNLNVRRYESTNRYTLASILYYELLYNKVKVCPDLRNQFAEWDNYLTKLGDRLLIILDGLHELSHDSPCKDTIEQLINRRNHTIVVTSNRYGVNAATFDYILQLESLEISYIKEIVEKRLKNNPQQKKLLLHTMSNNNCLTDLLQNPKMLSLMCSLYHSSIDNLFEQNSVTGIYTGLDIRIWQIFIERNGMVKATQKLLVEKNKIKSALEWIGYKGLEKNYYILNVKEIFEAIKIIYTELSGIEDLSILLPRILQTGILTTDSHDINDLQSYWFFAHPSLQQFYAAHCWVKLFMTNSQQSRDYLCRNKFNKKHDLFWVFATGILAQSSELDQYLKKYLEWLFVEEPHDVLGIQEIILLIRCLNECIHLLAQETFSATKQCVETLIPKLSHWLRVSLLPKNYYLYCEFSQILNSCEHIRKQPFFLQLCREGLQNTNEWVACCAMSWLETLLPTQDIINLLQEVLNSNDIILSLYAAQLLSESGYFLVDTVKALLRGASATDQFAQELMQRLIKSIQQIKDDDLNTIVALLKKHLLDNNKFAQLLSQELLIEFSFRNHDTYLSVVDGFVQILVNNEEQIRKLAATNLAELVKQAPQRNLLVDKLIALIFTNSEIFNSNNDALSNIKEILIRNLSTEPDILNKIFRDTVKIPRKVFQILLDIMIAVAKYPGDNFSKILSIVIPILLTIIRDAENNNRDIVISALVDLYVHYRNNSSKKVFELECYQNPLCDILNKLVNTTDQLVLINSFINLLRSNHLAGKAFGWDGIEMLIKTNFSQLKQNLLDLLSNEMRNDNPLHKVKAATLMIINMNADIQYIRILLDNIDKLSNEYQRMDLSWIMHLIGNSQKIDLASSAVTYLRHLVSTSIMNIASYKLAVQLLLSSHAFPNELLKAIIYKIDFTSLMFLDRVIKNWGYLYHRFDESYWLHDMLNIPHTEINPLVLNNIETLKRLHEILNPPQTLSAGGGRHDNYDSYSVMHSSYRHSYLYRHSTSSWITSWSQSIKYRANTDSTKPATLSAITLLQTVIPLITNIEVRSYIIKLLHHPSIDVIDSELANIIKGIASKNSLQEAIEELFSSLQKYVLEWPVFIKILPRIISKITTADDFMWLWNTFNQQNSFVATVIATLLGELDLSNYLAKINISLLHDISYGYLIFSSTSLTNIIQYYQEKHDNAAFQIILYRIKYLKSVFYLYNNQLYIIDGDKLFRCNLSQELQQNIITSLQLNYFEVTDIDPTFTFVNTLATVFQKAQRLSFENDIEAAIECFTQVITRSPMQTEVLQQLADLYAAQNKLELAKKMCEKILHFNPVNVTAHHNLACYYHILGNKQKAEEIFLHVLTLSTYKGSDFYCEYALFLYSEYYYKKSIDYCNQSIDMQHDRRKLYFNEIEKIRVLPEMRAFLVHEVKIEVNAVSLAYRLLISGYKKLNETSKVTESLVSFKLHVQKTTDSSDYLLLACSFWEVGNTEDACNYFNQLLLTSKKNHDLIAKWKEFLEQGKPYSDVFDSLYQQSLGKLLVNFPLYQVNRTDTHNIHAAINDQANQTAGSHEIIRNKS